MKCKWCDKQTSFPKGECAKCWEFLQRVDHALHTPKLFEMLKRLVEGRIEEIRKEENAKTEIQREDGLSDGG